MISYLVILFIIEIFLLVCAFILSEKDIMAPSVVMCGMFTISTLFALISMNVWNINYQAETCIIIASGITAFLFAENVAKFFWRSRKSKRTRITSALGGKSKSIIDIPKKYLILLLLVNILVIVWYYLEIRRIVLSTGNLTGGLFAAYRRLQVKLNVANESSNVDMVNIWLSQLIKLTKGAGYICLYVFINGFVNKNKSLIYVVKDNFLTLINIVLSIIPSLMLAGRNDTLQIVAAALVYYYILWHQKNGWKRNISLKYIRWGVLIILIGIPVFYRALFLLGRSTTKSMLEYVSIYIGGSIALFNQYLINPVAPPKVFGEETLLGLHTLLHRLGMNTVVKNRHLEFRHLNALFTSNTYTFFRRPLHDFGFIGMLMFTMAVAFFFSWFYYGLIKGTDNNKRSDFLTIIYGYLFYWVIYTSIDQRSISMLTVGTAVTFVIIFVELWVIKKVKI